MIRIVKYKHPMQLRIRMELFGKGLNLILFGLSIYVYHKGSRSKGLFIDPKELS